MPRIVFSIISDVFNDVSINSDSHALRTVIIMNLTTRFLDEWSEMFEDE